MWSIFLLQASYTFWSSVAHIPETFKWKSKPFTSNLKIIRHFLIVCILFSTSFSFAQSSIEHKINKTKKEIQSIFKKEEKKIYPDASSNKNTSTAEKNGNGSGANTSVNKKPEEELGETIEIKPSHQNLNGFVMPAYKNKVRLSSSDLVKIRPQTDGEVKYLQYRKLIAMKLFDSLYFDLNTEKLSQPQHINATKEERMSNKKPVQPPNVIKENNSNRAQYHLSALGGYFSSDKLYPTYFCPGGNCDKQRDFHKPFHWGGMSSTASEFDRLDAYRAFIKANNHVYLRKWWNEVDREAYLVKEYYLGEYDFDKQGFEITLDPELMSFRYIPFNGSTTIMIHSESNKGISNVHKIFPIDATKAKELRKRQTETRNRNVYIVFNIKFYDKIHPWGAATDNVLYFYLKNPAVEIYEDALLKNKIGDISFTK